MAVAPQRRGRAKDPTALTIPSLVTAFLGGLLVLGGRDYFVATGLLLVAAATLMVFKRTADIVEARTVRPLPAAVVGAGAGFISGLTGVGGGVFLTPLVIALGWASPKRAATISPPFILCNFVVGLLGVLLAGQKLAPGTPFYSLGALSGAVIGTAISLRWMSERAHDMPLRRFCCSPVSACYSDRAEAGAHDAAATASDAGPEGRFARLGGTLPFAGCSGVSQAIRWREPAEFLPLRGNCGGS